MRTLKEIIEDIYCRHSISLLIDTKYIIQEQFKEGRLLYDDYCVLMESVQNDLDLLCPIDISFI